MKILYFTNCEAYCGVADYGRHQYASLQNIALCTRAEIVGNYDFISLLNCMSESQADVVFFNWHRGILDISDLICLAQFARGMGKKVVVQYHYIDEHVINLTQHVVDLHIVHTQQAENFCRFHNIHNVYHNAHGIKCYDELIPRTGIQDKYIVHVGFCSENKGHLQFIKAFAKIHAEHPEYKYIVYAAKNDFDVRYNDYLNRIKAQCELLHVADSVEIINQNPSTDELTQIISRSEFAVFPHLNPYSGEFYETSGSIRLAIPTQTNIIAHRMPLFVGVENCVDMFDYFYELPELFNKIITQRGSTISTTQHAARFEMIRQTSWSELAKKLKSQIM